jgi:hypothetical protein
MELLIDSGGVGHCVYAETIALTELGKLDIRRASHVEPMGDNYWYVDLAPVGGAVLGPFVRRSDALDAERRWLERWMTGAHCGPGHNP